MKTYTVKQTSEILGVLEAAVRAYIKKGLLQATKVRTLGLRVAYEVKETDLQEFIKTYKNKA